MIEFYVCTPTIWQFYLNLTDTNYVYRQFETKTVSMPLLFNTFHDSFCI
jgi:hypothetical protein